MALFCRFFGIFCYIDDSLSYAVNEAERAAVSEEERTYLSLTFLAHNKLDRIEIAEAFARDDRTCAVTEQGVLILELSCRLIGASRRTVPS